MIYQKVWTIHKIKLLNCLKCKRKRNTKRQKPKVMKSKNGRIMFISKSVCGSKKLTFIKEQDASGLLRKLKSIKELVLSDLIIANILL